MITEVLEPIEETNKDKESRLILEGIGSVSDKKRLLYTDNSHTPSKVSKREWYNPKLSLFDPKQTVTVKILLVLGLIVIAILLYFLVGVSLFYYNSHSTDCFIK